jgi:hypothetical protein
MKNKVNDSLYSLEEWVSRNGWAGYDPYDIKGQEWFVKLFGKQIYFLRKIRGVLAIIEGKLPAEPLRKALNIEKTINAKGMGLLASGYLSLYRVTKKTQYLDNAENILNWLLQNYNKEFPGMSWGYPFHWFSRIFIPRGTPSSVVTGTVGDAWIEHYLITKSEKSLNVCCKIAEFFLNALRCEEITSGEVCFSYTPIDNFKVLNASLFVAAFLAKLSTIINEGQYTELSLKVVRYTLSEQNNDGSFPYWGAEPHTIIDHYHTGFVLRHLDTIHKSTHEDFILEPLRRGYSFYLEKLFTIKGVPKYTPDALYPIDVHSLSEAILCLTQISFNLKDQELIEKVLNFSLNNLLTKQGYYIASINKFWGLKQKQNIPYMRWGQAWMFLALARLNEKLTSKGGN